MSALRLSSAALTSSSSQRRTSVATWSLRERPVCSLPPSGPMSSLRRRSLAVWMSSSSSWGSNCGAGQGCWCAREGEGTHDAIGPLLAHGGEAGDHARLLGGGEDADEGEGLGVRDGAADVDGGHALVVLERLVEGVHAAGVSAAHKCTKRRAHRGSVFPVKRPPQSFCFVGASAMVSEWRR